MEVDSPMTLVMRPQIAQPAAMISVLSALSPMKPLSGDASACAMHGITALEVSAKPT